MFAQAVADVAPEQGSVVHTWVRRVVAQREVLRPRRARGSPSGSLSVQCIAVTSGGGVHCTVYITLLTQSHTYVHTTTTSSYILA